MRSLPFLAGAAFLLVHQAASADTLREALTRAYNSNPTLTAQRANVRAVDENVPIARSGGLPSLEASAGYTENIVKDDNIRNNFAAPERQINAGLNLTVPLLTFGAVGGAVRAADKRVEAARLGLRGTEADLFTAVVGAYMDVIRDDAVVTLNQQNLKMLDANMKANSERYEVGELNSTDVAQSRARQALGRSQLQTAEARLISSRENYIRLVGVAPGILETPPPLPNMPADPDTAVDIAIDNNANLLAAKKAREAADEDITIAKAGRLPRLNGVAGGNYVDYLKTLGNGTLPRSDQTIPSASIGLALQVPIYQGGRPSAQIRQAQARSGQAIEQTIEAERTVVAQTRSAFAIWKSSLSVIESAEVGVAANKESLDGVRAENQVGTRTILDLLNAQQELLNSRVTMVTAQRDAYVAGFALLAAMGRAEARDLGLDGGPLYDPKVNYDRVRNHLGDWETDRAPQGIATGTSDIPAQGSDPRMPLDPSLNVIVTAPE